MKKEMVFFILIFTFLLFFDDGQIVIGLRCILQFQAIELVDYSIYILLFKHQ